MQYETFPGWKKDISNARTFDELPVNAQNFVRFIEMELGIPGKRSTTASLKGYLGNHTFDSYFCNNNFCC